MKRFSLLIVILIPLTFLAQPVLTMENCAPVPGSSFEMLQLDEMSPLFPGAAGENVTWDFSTISADSPITSMNHIFAPPSSSPYYSSHPTATVVRYKQEVHNFYVSTSDSLVFVGANGSDSYNFSPDPYLVLPFPFTYLNTTSNTSSNWGNSGTDDYELSLSGTYTADAYGTLILPGGITLTNVLRVIIDEEEVFYVPADNFTLETHRTIYRWYKPGVKEFVLEYVERFPSGWPVYRSATAQSASSILGFEENSVNQLAIFPNPILSDGIIVLPKTKGPKTLMIYSSDNKLVLSLSGITKENFVLHSADFAPGIYMCDVYTEEGERTTCRIIIL